MRLLFLFFSWMLMFPEGNLMDWSPDRKLVWADFRASPDPASPNAALTSTSIQADFGFSNKSLTFHIRCQFDKNKSWVRVRNDYILSHEQGHFDIAEIYARLLDKTLKEYKPDQGNIGKEVNQIYEDVMHRYRERQAQYDTETQFSENAPKQREWLKKIVGELEDLGPYSMYR